MGFEHRPLSNSQALIYTGSLVAKECRIDVYNHDIHMYMAYCLGKAVHYGGGGALPGDFPSTLYLLGLGLGRGNGKSNILDELIP